MVHELNFILEVFIMNKNFTFTVEKASDWDYEEVKTFSSLDELMNWIEEIDSKIIINKKNRIIIYDDYIE